MIGAVLVPGSVLGEVILPGFVTRSSLSSGSKNGFGAAGSSFCSPSGAGCFTVAPPIRAIAAADFVAAAFTRPLLAAFAADFARASASFNLLARTRARPLAARLVAADRLTASASFRLLAICVRLLRTTLVFFLIIVLACLGSRLSNACFSAADIGRSFAAFFTVFFNSGFATFGAAFFDIAARPAPPGAMIGARVDTAFFT